MTLKAFYCILWLFIKTHQSSTNTLQRAIHFTIKTSRIHLKLLSLSSVHAYVQKISPGSSINLSAKLILHIDLFTQKLMCLDCKYGIYIAECLNV